MSTAWLLHRYQSPEIGILFSEPLDHCAFESTPLYPQERRWMTLPPVIVAVYVLIILRRCPQALSTDLHVGCILAAMIVNPSYEALAAYRILSFSGLIHCKPMFHRSFTLVVTYAGAVAPFSTAQTHPQHPNFASGHSQNEASPALSISHPLP